MAAKEAPVTHPVQKMRRYRHQPMPRWVLEQAGILLPGSGRNNQWASTEEEADVAEDQARATVLASSLAGWMYR